MLRHVFQNFPRWAIPTNGLSVDRPTTSKRHRAERRHRYRQQRKLQAARESMSDAPASRRAADSSRKRSLQVYDYNHGMAGPSMSDGGGSRSDQVAREGPNKRPCRDLSRGQRR